MMMKRLCVLMIMALWLCGAVAAENVLIDRIVAIVNGEIITYSELQRFKALSSMGAPEQARGAAAERKLLDQLIEKKIIVQAAEEAGVEVDKHDVDRAIEGIIERNKISLAMLADNLKLEGLTLPEYRALMKEEIIQSKVINREVQSRVNITDKDVEAFYEANIKPDEKPGARVRLQQIVLFLPKDAPADQAALLEKNAREIREKIVAGEDFSRLAATYSQDQSASMGGDLGYFHKGEMLPEIEQVAFSLKTGEVSQVVRTQAGFHLIKILDKDMNVADRSWQDHENDISRVLYGKKYEQQFQEWILGLKQKAYIDIKL
ncbi:MAG: hypothetical protein GY868_17545 [Deltaproteobacteria bacterium]|nr:hypothetical protein [Deltaproteobacteria bacterium]